MSKRNIIWLVAIVAVAAVVWVVAGVLWGLGAGVAVLVISEVVERQARRRRQEARGGTASRSLRDEIDARKER